MVWGSNSYLALSAILGVSQVRFHTSYSASKLATKGAKSLTSAVRKAMVDSSASGEGGDGIKNRGHLLCEITVIQ